METYEIKDHDIFMSTRRGNIISKIEGAVYGGLLSYICILMTDLPQQMTGANNLLIICILLTAMCSVFGVFVVSMTKKSLFAWRFFRNPPEKVVKQYKKQLVDSFKEKIKKNIQKERSLEKENIKIEGFITQLSS